MKPINALFLVAVQEERALPEMQSRKGGQSQSEVPNVFCGCCLAGQGHWTNTFAVSLAPSVKTAAGKRKIAGGVCLWRMLRQGFLRLHTSEGASVGEGRGEPWCIQPKPPLPSSSQKWCWGNTSPIYDPCPLLLQESFFIIIIFPFFPLVNSEENRTFCRFFAVLLIRKEILEPYQFFMETR